jgi:hypothetical protein
LREQIERDEAVDQIVASWGPELETFRRVRDKYLLYS